MTCPSVGRSSSSSRRSSVLLPAPLGPVRNANSPFWTVRLRRRSAYRSCPYVFDSDCVSITAVSLTGDSRLHQVGNDLRVALAARFLHHLSDQELELAILAGANLGDDVGVRVDHLAHNRLDARGVGILRQPLRGNDVGRGPAAVVHLRKDVLGDRGTDGALLDD